MQKRLLIRPLCLNVLFVEGNYLVLTTCEHVDVRIFDIDRTIYVQIWKAMFLSTLRANKFSS